MRRLVPCTPWALLAAGCTVPNPAFDLESAGPPGGGTTDAQAPTTAAASDPGSGPGSTAAPDGSTTQVGASGTGTTGPSTGGESDATSGDATTGPAPLVLPDCDSADPLLRACYDFDDLSLLPEETPDGSQFHNDAAVSAVSFEPGLEGLSAVVGSGSQIAAPASVSLSNLEPLTAAAWFRVEPPVRWPARMGVLDKRGRYSINIHAEPPDGVTCEVAGARVPSGDLADDGAWHHVACVYDGELLALYLDGERVGESLAPDEPQPEDKAPLCVAGNGLGDFTFGCQEPLVGSIDAVRVWSRTLSEAEICAHAQCP